jgi:hypothetical protein
MGENSPETDALEELYVPPWSPSLRLRRQLFTGIWATLVAAGLSAASSVVALSQGPIPGFTLSHELAWASFVPALWIVGMYRTLARETESPSLKKSTLGLFGAVFLLAVNDLATLNLFPFGGQVVVWIVFALATVILLVLPFVSEDDVAEAPQETAPSPDSEADAPPPSAEPASDDADTATSTGGKLGIIGALAVGLLAILKLLGKGFFLKIMALRAGAKLFQGLDLDWGAVAAGVAILLAIGYLVWFALSKIRLRSRLGGLAALLGWAEILGLLVFAGVGTWYGIQLAATADQPGIDEQVLAGLEQTIIRDLTALGAVTELLWASLMIGFFWSLYSRSAPE